MPCPSPVGFLPLHHVHSSPPHAIVSVRQSARPSAHLRERRPEPVRDSEYEDAGWLPALVGMQERRPQGRWDVSRCHRALLVSRPKRRGGWSGRGRGVPFRKGDPLLPPLVPSPASQKGLPHGPTSPPGSLASLRVMPGTSLASPLIARGGSRLKVSGTGNKPVEGSPPLHSLHHPPDAHQGHQGHHHHPPTLVGKKPAHRSRSSTTWDMGHTGTRGHEKFSRHSTPRSRRAARPALTDKSCARGACCR